MAEQINGLIYLWTALVGFDKNLPDNGVQEYLDKLGYTPDGISLFVFNPDIVNLHEPGLKKEKLLPLSNCNYYGAIRNGIRDTQQWSNHELRSLCRQLRRRGIKCLLGIMGVAHGGPAETISDSVAPPTDAHQAWLDIHPELRGTGSLNVLKRFADGTYYEAFLARKLREVLRDYEMDGVHLADQIMPQASKTMAVDCSDDIVDQFTAHSGIVLPRELAAPLDARGPDAIARRRTYIWNEHRIEWLRFYAWRWERFVKTLCDALHEEGREVAANGFWCTDAFEAYYRYGVDYKALDRAGLDWLMLEDQASSVFMWSEEETCYNMQKYNLMPLMVRAFVPDVGLLGLNAVKDSTEEWSVINHMPCALEREIYSLPTTFLQTKNGLRRSLDGFLVCLADGMTREEWAWLRERYRLIFDEVPERVLAPLMVWSDSLVYDFVPEYIETRRWSHYKQLYEFGMAGGQIAGAIRIEDLDAASGPLFVPNIDIFPLHEQERIAAYDRGPVVCTSLASKKYSLPGGAKPEIYFEDSSAECRMCAFGYHLQTVDTARITETLGQDDGTTDIAGLPRLAPEPDRFSDEMVYRKVSTGFVTACGRLIRSLYMTPIDGRGEDLVLPFAMADGRIRILLANDAKLQYRRPVLSGRTRIRRLETHSAFPALPPKLITRAGGIVVAKTPAAFEDCDVTGFIHKVPPHGASIVDIWLE